MIIESKRIGTLEVNEERIIQFKDGLLGFPECKRFILADDPSDLLIPFKWLVSIENPELAFLVTDPGIFFKDYTFDLPTEDQNTIGAQTEEDVSVLTILSVPDNPKEITANLRGPLVVNWKTLVGRQVVLSDAAYGTKHFIFNQAVTTEKTQEPEKEKTLTPAAPQKSETSTATKKISVDVPTSTVRTEVTFTKPTSKETADLKFGAIGQD